MFKNYSKVNFLSPGEALTKRLYYKVSEVLNDYLYPFALKMSVLAFQLPKNPSQIPVCVNKDNKDTDTQLSRMSDTVRGTLETVSSYFFSRPQIPFFEGNSTSPLEDDLDVE